LWCGSSIKYGAGSIKFILSVIYAVHQSVKYQPALREGQTVSAEMMNRRRPGTHFGNCVRFAYMASKGSLLTQDNKKDIVNGQNGKSKIK
jgi:hypothetical protein